jgi:hypothetical protein
MGERTLDVSHLSDAAEDLRHVGQSQRVFRKGDAFLCPV